MDVLKETLSQIETALPQNFDFYHLGKVILEPVQSFSEDVYAIAYGLAGDLRAAIVILFDKGLDVSTYSEMGNIIVSQLSTQLSKNEGLDLIVSPPQNLSPTQLKSI